MAVFQTINIGGVDIIKPNDFSPAREYIYAGEITTCTGKTIADIVGWKYSDMTLEWDSLPQDQLTALLALNGTSVSMTFEDADGRQTENIIPRTHSMTATRTIKDGVPVWQAIKTEVVFIDAHN